MRYFDYSQIMDATRAFTGGHEGDFDLVELANVLFEEVPGHPKSDTVFIEREYTDEEIQGCDLTSWGQAVEVTEDGIMLFERWFQSRLGPIHVGAWEDIDGTVSLILSTVECGGDSPWDATSKVVGDTNNPDTWGEFDKAYGSRAAWESDLATAKALIKEF